MVVSIDAKESFFANKFGIYVQELDSESGEYVDTEITSNIFLPTDIAELTPLKYNKAYYNDNGIFQNIYEIDVTGDTSGDFDKTAIYTIGKNIFGTESYNESVLIDNFKVSDGAGNITDLTGVYEINNSTQYHNSEYFVIELNTLGYTLISNPTVRIIKGYNISITRVNQDSSATVSDRYLIEKIYL